MMELVTNFFNHPIFSIIGGITVICLILGFFYKIFMLFFRITPITFRLGIALWKRKIAIFGSSKQFGILKTLLIDSKIFKEQNIICIDEYSMEKAKDKTIYLIDWETMKEKIENIFNMRKDEQTAIIIYAKPQSIPPEKMSDIADRQNTVIVNFKGRLLNDILTSLITTSYEKK